MATYPQRGEYYQRKNVPEPWAVYILGVKFNDAVFIVNPEFYCEVKFIYENSGYYSEMPISWFRDAYTKVYRPHKNHYPGQKRNKKYFPDYSWVNDDS